MKINKNGKEKNSLIFLNKEITIKITDNIYFLEHYKEVSSTIEEEIEIKLD